MPHIPLPEGVPGILGPMQFRPETGAILRELAEVLLRGENTLTRGERELIAARVSELNRTRFCVASHGAFAARQLEGGRDVVRAVIRDPATAPVSDKMRALLNIAGKVQESGLAVTSDDIDAAHAAGATDNEVHDAVLIAAAFCMFNRYVDGLATWAPDDDASYDMMSEVIVEHGYRILGGQ
jgi:uncharacterized peroxidase-related enzyme